MIDFEKEVEEMSFEECIKELESLVKELENGGMDLDRSVEIYEKAIVLRNRCKKVLDESERKIQKLIETAGEPRKEEFSVE